jgi:hypothetical protein
MRNQGSKDESLSSCPACGQLNLGVVLTGQAVVDRVPGVTRGVSSGILRATRV